MLLKLPKSLSTFVAFASRLVGLRAIGARLREAIDDWMDMAPYRVRTMTANLNGRSATGIGSLRSANRPAFSRGIDEFSRRSMTVWSFVDSDRRNFGKTSLITAQQWMRLAAVYREFGRPGEAIEYYLRGVKIFRRRCRSADPRLLDALRTMADCYLWLGRLEPAEFLLREVARSIDADEAEVSRLDKSPILLLLYRTLKEQAKLPEAFEVLQDFVAVQEDSGLPTSDEAIDAYRELAWLSGELGKVEDAEMFSEMARLLTFVAIAEKSVGDRNFLIREFDRLAVFYRRRQKNHIVSLLNTRSAICRLQDKVSRGYYAGVAEDLERLAVLCLERDAPGDTTSAVHLRARAKRVRETEKAARRIRN